MYWFDGPTEKFQAKWSACLIIFRDNDERYSTELVVAFIECCSVLYLYQTWALNPSKIVVKEFNFSKVAGIKVRTQHFSAKCWKKIFFFWYPYLFWKDLPMKYLVVLKFLLKVPKFKENFPLHNYLWKLHDLFLTLLQVIRMLEA